MVCQHCGCRMVAKSTAGTMVCADCGHPADARAYRDMSRRSWAAALALMGFAVFSGLVLAYAVLLDLRHDEANREPPAASRQE